MRVSLTSSAIDSLVSETPLNVVPKILSLGLGFLTSRVIFTVLLRSLVRPSFIFVAVRIHLVVVFPTSTDATMKKLVISPILGSPLRSAGRIIWLIAILGFGPSRQLSVIFKGFSMFSLRNISHRGTENTEK